MSLFLYVNDHKMGEYPNEQLRELIAYARRQSATDEVELWRGYKKPEAMILRLAPETYLGSVNESLSTYVLPGIGNTFSIILGTDGPPSIVDTYGYVEVGPVLEETENARRDLDALEAHLGIQLGFTRYGMRFRALKVARSYVNDAYRNQHLGVRLYVAAVAEAAKRGFALVPDSYDATGSGGRTSTDARRVWASRSFAAAVVKVGLTAFAQPSTLGDYPECWTIAIHDHPNAKKPVRYYGCWATRLGAEQVLEAIRIHIRRARRWRVIKR